MGVDQGSSFSRLSRREFLRWLGLGAVAAAASACGFDQGSRIKEETTLISPERVLVFKEGVVVNLVRGLSVAVDQKNITRLYDEPNMRLSKPSNYFGTYYLFEKGFDSQEAEKNAEGVIAQVSPYVMSRFLAEQKAPGKWKEFSSAASIKYSLPQLKTLIDAGPVSANEAFSLLISLAWVETSMRALYGELGVPLTRADNDLSFGQKAFIAQNLPIKVTHISDDLLKQAGVR